MAVDTVILKLGGALITDKSKGVFDRAKNSVIKNLAKEISESVNDKIRLIIVHGAGSFGHPYIEKYGFPLSVRAVSDTHLACERLCCIVCKHMLDVGLNPMPIHPFTCFFVDDSNDFVNIKFSEELFETPDFIPVTHGDVVRCKKGGWTVLSGDDITIELAIRFNAKRVGFVTKTQIICNRKPVSKFSISEHNLEEIKVKNVSDVTGGMAGKLKKIEKIAKMSEVFVFSGTKKGSISAFLAGKHVGTRVLP